MAFADPQSIKISGVTTSLPRVSSGSYQSKYQSADGLTILTALTQLGKRVRQVVRLDRDKITADPFIPANNVEVGTSISVVIDRPASKVGFTDAEEAALIAGFIELLTKEESKIITKLLAAES